ncbi:hypothetical protein GW797_07985 [Candidatus Parcubacteria bacterium]|nr:hypothetical protein [Candidatus Parcubacteria bacterium]
MYLIFDTETTGLNRRLDHLVQIAWILVNDAGEVESEECYVIRPQGYSIPVTASKIHGITTATATSIGESIDFVLERFSEAALKAEAIVAHNLSFDYAILQHDYKNAGKSFPLYGKVQVCTMKLSTSWCRLPKLNGATGFKYPKLDELYFSLFGEGFEGAHDALADARACMRCYFELVAREIISSPLSTSIQAPPKFHKLPKKEEVFLQFPDAGTWGKVFLSDGIGDDLFDIKERVAQGKVMIPSGYFPSLIIPDNVETFAFLQHCDPLNVLQELDARGTKFTDKDMLFIANMKSLRSLIVRHTPVSGDGFLYLHALHRLEEIDLMNCDNLSDSCFRHMSAFPALKKLLLGRSAITEAGINHLGALEGIEELFLWGTKVSDKSLQYLKGLRRLKKLNLSRTEISDAGVDCLRDLANLLLLNLELTNVSDQKKSDLRISMPLCHIM